MCFKKFTKKGIPIYKETSYLSPNGLTIVWCDITMVNLRLGVSQINQPLGIIEWWKRMLIENSSLWRCWDWKPSVMGDAALKLAHIIQSFNIAHTIVMNKHLTTNIFSLISGNLYYKPFFLHQNLLTIFVKHIDL